MAAFGSGEQVAAEAATYNVPNFVGELYKLSPLETPLLTLLGGMSGGIAEATTQFQWQDTLHRAPADQSNVEGADATFSSQKRTDRKNVVQIFQYGVEVTYSKQAATGLVGTSLAGAPAGVAGVDAAAVLGTQPVQDEIGFQTTTKIEQAALDVEWAFLNGTFANPTTAAARKTQGIVGAITSIALDADDAADWSTSAGTAIAGRQMVNETMQALFTNGAKNVGVGLDGGGSIALMVDGASKLLISSSFQGASGALQPRSYNKFGVNITDIETDFGQVSVILNRHSPAETPLFLNLGVMRPRYLPIPGRGHFFVEPLAKNGSYDRAQLYGEIGLEYGPEGWHAKVTNFDGVTVTA